MDGLSQLLRRRLVDSSVSLLCLVFGVFFLARLTGDPAKLYLPVDATPEMIHNFEVRNGFDKSTWAQFIDFIRDLAQLDFGDSLRRHQPALEVVLSSYPTTLKLLAAAMTIAIVSAVILGCCAALRPMSFFDRAVTTFSVGAASLPDFWIALMAIWLFAVNLQWLPTSGTGGIEYWILPVFVIVLNPVGNLVQVIRGAMIDTLSSTYVKAATARGIFKWRVIFIHAFRNASLPFIAVTGIQTAAILNGAVIVETTFGWPGIGNLLLTSIRDRDFAVVQCAVLVTGAAIFLLNIFIDILYGLVDTRVRSAQGAAR